MAAPVKHSPVLLLLAAFSRHDDALAWTESRAVEMFGPIAMKSERFHFDQTEYYTAEMGPGLRKCFFAFERLIDPAQLVDLKLTTNAWEVQYADHAGHDEPRPLNLDPGYLTLGKLVLASAKDYAHRIYLDRGIYAEITLFYRGGEFRAHEWTFPDYQRADYQAFLRECREYLHRRRRSS